MKQIVTGVSIIIENFFDSEFVKYCRRSSISGNILQTFGSKIFTDDPDASHYLYIVIL